MNSATLNFSPLIFPQQNINFLFLLIPHLSSLFPIQITGLQSIGFFVQEPATNFIKKNPKTPQELFVLHFCRTFYIEKIKYEEKRKFWTCVTTTLNFSGIIGYLIKQRDQQITANHNKTLCQFDKDCKTCTGKWQFHIFGL